MNTYRPVVLTFSKLTCPLKLELKNKWDGCNVFLFFFFFFYVNESKVMNYLKIPSTFLMGSQVALVVKNLPDNSGDIRNAGWIPWWRRSASPGSMHDTRCLGLMHWDDPEGWDGEGGRRGIQDGELMYTHGGFKSIQWQNQYNIVK